MDIPTALWENYITRGVILHSTMFENIDHGKFFVIIGVNDDYVAGFFFINSNVNIHLYNKPEQLAMQYPMKKADYEFLRYDSFLSATRIEKIKRNKLVETMAQKVTTVVGNMKKEHINELLEAARHSPLFSKHQIRQFLY